MASQSPYTLNPADQNNWAISNGFTGWQDFQSHLSNNDTKAQNALGGNTGGASTSTFDPVAQAKALQQFYVQANQPAINTLQQQYNPTTGSGALVDRYNQLLQSITSQGSVAVNAQTLATGTTMGARGITPDSALYQQQMAQSLLPVTSQYAGLTAQAGLGEQQDLGNIASQIASLQAGNAPGAVSAATNLLQLQQQQALAGSQLAFQQQYVTIPNVGVLNTSTGSMINQLSGMFGGNNVGGIQMVNGQPMVNIS